MQPCWYHVSYTGACIDDAARLLSQRDTNLLAFVLHMRDRLCTRPVSDCDDSEGSVSELMHRIVSAA